MSNLIVPDYSIWVKEEEEMWLEEIKNRIRQGHYTTHEAMLADMNQIHSNAVKYNTIGNGQIGMPGMYILSVAYLRRDMPGSVCSQSRTPPLELMTPVDGSIHITVITDASVRATTRCTRACLLP